LSRILLDENLPVQLKKELLGHEVRSVAEMKWSGIDNGVLRRMEGAFDILITADKNIYAQQNLSGRSLSILVVPTNKRRTLMALAQPIRDAVSTLGSSTYATLRFDGKITPRKLPVRGDEER
jgi:hypothetical protein